ncbi:hypothetical protein SAMN05421755_10386 [Nitrosomonas sp. Nm33]|nr:hypothetical protein SAMN05421755_10386 [Nitrosomonas sp. Nm33]
MFNLDSSVGQDGVCGFASAGQGATMLAQSVLQRKHPEGENEICRKNYYIHNVNIRMSDQLRNLGLIHAFFTSININCGYPTSLISPCIPDKRYDKCNFFLTKNLLKWWHSVRPRVG